MRVRQCERLIVSKTFCASRRLAAATLPLCKHKHTATTGNTAQLHNRLPAENPKNTDPSSSFWHNVSRLSKTLAVPVWSFDVEHALSNLPFQISLPHVVHILKHHQNARVALCFFFWLRHLRGYRHNNLTYNNAAHVLIRAKEFRFFEQIFLCLQKDGCYLSSITCNALIQAYGAAHKVEEAFDIFSRMDGRFLCKPNILTCNLLLHILIKENELNWACEFYHRILNLGFVPDIFTCNIWMLYLCRSKKLDEASLWLMEMPHPPNFVSYSTLIDGLCKSVKMVEARSLFDRMLDNDMSLDVFVFSSLIDGYCKAGMLQEAWKFFKLMGGKGVVANIVTYTSLLDGMFKAGNTDGALGLLECMQSDGCVPNVHLCTVRIDALCKQGNLEAAGDFLKHMSEVGCVPNTVTYCALIDGFMKAGRTPEAMEWLSEMSASGCEPDGFLYSSLVYGFGMASGDSKAKLIVEESLAKRSEPDTWVMNCWLSSLVQTDRVGDAYHLFTHLKAEGFTPNTITYNILITGFSKSSKVGFASLMFEGIQQANCLPDLSSYTNLIKGYCKVGAVSHASKLLVDSSYKGFVHVFRHHVYSVLDIFETRRVYHAKSFLKLLGTCCTFDAAVDRKLFVMLLEARDSDAAAKAVEKWKRLRRS